MKYCVFFLALFSANELLAQQCYPPGQCDTGGWHGSPYNVGPQFPGIPVPPKPFDPPAVQPEPVQPSAPTGGNDHLIIVDHLKHIAKGQLILGENQAKINAKIKALQAALDNATVDVNVPGQTNVVVNLQQEVNTLIEAVNKQSSGVTELDKTIGLLIETTAEKYDEHDTLMASRLDEIKALISDCGMDYDKLDEALQNTCTCDPDRVIAELKAYLTELMAVYHTQEEVIVDSRDFPLVIYLTVKGDPRCRDSDEAVERKIEAGFNIRVVELSTTDTAVLDVPKAFYFPSGRVIRGSSNIRVFLANLVK